MYVRALGGAALPNQDINKRSTGKLGSRWSVYRLMVGPNGFEPATSRLSGVRSNQLSYGPLKVLEYCTLARFVGQVKNNPNRENIW